MSGRICDFSKFNPGVILDRPNAEPEVLLTRDEVYLRILTFDGISNTEGSSSEIHGLIVKRTLYLRDDFERIGYFSMPIPSKSSEFFKRMHSQPKKEIILV